MGRQEPCMNRQTSWGRLAPLEWQKRAVVASEPGTPGFRCYCLVLNTDNLLPVLTFLHAQHSGKVVGLYIYRRILHVRHLGINIPVPVMDAAAATDAAECGAHAGGLVTFPPCSM